MIIALFIIAAAVVSTPIAAIVVVSMASRREDATWSLGEPAPGLVQAAARRLLGFHTEDQAWPLPKNCGQARPAAPAPAAPALRSIARGSVGQGTVGHPRRSTVTATPRSAATSKVTMRTAA